MAPKDGLEQPTTREEEPVEEDEEPFNEDPFAEADEVGRITPAAVSNSDESEEFVTSRCHLSNCRLFSEEILNFLIHHHL